MFWNNSSRAQFFIFIFVFVDVSLDENPEKWKNAPVGLQLIGQRLEEEKIVGILYEIEKALG